jgi:ATP-dependent Zn protease
MKKAALMLIFLLVLILSCKTKYVPVEVKTTEKVEYHDTSVVVELVPYKDSIVTPDTTSYLSNKYAYSWAKVKDGMLQHSLGIFPNTRDTITLTNTVTITKEKEIPIIQEVVKKQPWWQRLVNMISLFIVIVAFFMLCYFVFRRVRKKLV